MSIKDHQNEVAEWLDTNCEAKVWCRPVESPGEWVGTFDPQWKSNHICFVDNKHASMRKDWYDKGKPPVERYSNRYNAWLPDPTPEWFAHKGYRFKKQI